MFGITWSAVLRRIIYDLEKWNYSTHRIAKRCFPCIMLLRTVINDLSSWSRPTLWAEFASAYQCAWPLHSWRMKHITKEIPTEWGLPCFQSFYCFRSTGMRKTVSRTSRNPELLFQSKYSAPGHLPTIRLRKSSSSYYEPAPNKGPVTVKIAAASSGYL